MTEVHTLRAHERDFREETLSRLSFGRRSSRPRTRPGISRKITTTWWSTRANVRCGHRSSFREVRRWRRDTPTRTKITRPLDVGDLSLGTTIPRASLPLTCPSGRKIDGPPPGSTGVLRRRGLPSLTATTAFGGGRTATQPRLKRFLSDVKAGKVPQTPGNTRKLGTPGGEEGASRARYFESPETVFDTPKPTRLVQRMLRLATTPGRRAGPDFFAGSGSTGDAVMRLNCEDDGNRRFIMVQASGTTGDSDMPTSLRCQDEDHGRCATAQVRADALLDSTERDLGFRAFRYRPRTLRCGIQRERSEEVASSWSWRPHTRFGVR